MKSRTVSTRTQRAAIAKALGVDAVAVARVLYSVGSKDGMVNVTTHPRAVVQFTVYDAKTNEPIWTDKHAVGEVTKDGLVAHAGFKSDDHESEVFINAADSAMDALVARYQGQGQ